MGDILKEFRDKALFTAATYAQEIRDIADQNHFDRDLFLEKVISYMVRLNDKK